MPRRRKPPGGAGRTKRLRKKLFKYLWSHHPSLPSGKYIYHGTSDAKSPAVRKNGLRPRGNNPSEWELLESHPQMVYLTDSYPHVFGTQTGSSVTVAFEIDITQLDPRRLYPDEDFLVQKNLVAAVAGRSIHDVAKAKVKAFQSRWIDSLLELGTCCYSGRVPPYAFVALTSLSREHNMPLATLMASHEVGIEEHAAVGKNYRIVNKWLFGRCGIRGDIYTRHGVSHETL